MADNKIDALLQSLTRNEHKKSVYEKLRAHLALLIDDALPNDMLPIAVPKDVAVEVLDELKERSDDLDDERKQLVRTATTPKKLPKRKPSASKPKAPPRKKPAGKKKAAAGAGEPVSLDQARKKKS